MKRLKQVGLAAALLPFLAVVLFLLYELCGMCVNHIATWRQTDTLGDRLACAVPDIRIVRVYSETGNTGGTGNHVDCLSLIEFTTDMTEAEVEERMAGYYAFDPLSCYIRRTDEGHYLFYLNTSAPFADNLEGH